MERISRPWLAPNLSVQARADLVHAKISALGWAVRRWPSWAPRFLQKLSQAQPLWRRLYLADEKESDEEIFFVLVHEWEHIQRAESQGRWGWVWRYAGAPALLVLGACLWALAGLLAVVDIAFWPAVLGHVSVIGGALLWRRASAFRRNEEIWAFAAKVAADLVHDEADFAPVNARSRAKNIPLYGFRYPYFVGGSESQLLDDVADRALVILKDEERANEASIT